MKAVLAGLTLGAATFLASYAAGMSATEAKVPRVEAASYQPGAGDGGFSELASVSVLAPQRIEWSQDGNSLYIQGLDSISQFEPANQSMTSLIDVPAAEMVLDISSSGMVASMRNFETVVLRDAHDGSETTLVRGVNISSASFAPDGETIALVLDDGSVLQVWDVENAQMTGEYTSPSLAEQAFSVSYAPSGDSLTWYSVMGGQSIDLNSGDIGPFVAFSTAIYDVQMCTDVALLVAQDGATLTLWDTTAANVVHTTEDLQVFSNSCSVEGDRVAITTESHVGLLSMPTLAAIEWLPLEAVDAELSPSGDRLAVVGIDGRISVWEGN